MSDKNSYFNLPVHGESPTLKSAAFIILQMRWSELDQMANIIEELRSNGKKESRVKVTAETLHLAMKQIRKVELR